MLTPKNLSIIAPHVNANTRELIQALAVELGLNNNELFSCVEKEPSDVSKITIFLGDDSMPLLQGKMFRYPPLVCSSYPPETNAFTLLWSISEPSAIFNYIPRSADNSSPQKILVLYNPYSTYSQNVYHFLYPHIHRNNIQVQKIPITESISRLDTLAIKNTDIVLLLAENQSPSYVQRLALLCMQHKSVLCVANTKGIEFGASIAFGLDYQNMGGILGNLLRQYFSDTNVALQTGSLTVPIDFKIHINPFALEEQSDRSQEIDTTELNLIAITKLVNPTIKEKIDAYVRLESIPLE